MNIWEQSFDDLRRPYLEEKKGDGNLANNYPPYDKVTRGDIIAGALGKDQMGGKKKKKNVKEAKNGGVSKAGEVKFHKNLDTLVHDTFGKRKDEKKKACEHSDWRSDLSFFNEEDCGCDGPIKPKKGVKNKVTINPDLKTEENINENPLVGLGIRAGLAAGTALAGKMVYDKAKGVAGKLQQRNQQTQKAIDSLNNSYEPEGKEISEREMTSGEMKKEKELKKKYDPSGMKSSMKKQYGAEKGKQVYFATIRKQAMEHLEDGAFAGNYEGPLYAPHPDIEEGYKEIDKKKENAMYRRAGNLARTSLSSRGKKKEEAQTKSSKIVSAITRQKEKERFDRIGQSPTHNEGFVDPEHGEAPSGRTPLENVSDHPKASVRKTAVKGFKKQMGKEYGGKWKSRSSDPVKEALETELDYYLGEALRPASERMKRTQTASGRKKQEQEREKKSKLEAEADKILAGFSKKGTGTAKTKAAPKPEAPEANRTLKSGKKKDTLAMKANKAMSEQENKALAMVRASVGPGLMTGKTKKPKPTEAQKAASKKASDAYQRKTSEYLHSSPRD